MLLLLLSAVLSSCSGVRVVYRNEQLSKETPRHILYTQSMGIEALNGIRVDGENYFNTQVEAVLIHYNIKGTPVRVDFNEQDSAKIARLLEEQHADGILFTRASRTYVDYDGSIATQYALSPGSGMMFTYFNAEGRKVAATWLLPSVEYDLINFMQRKMPKGIHSLFKFYATEKWIPPRGKPVSPPDAGESNARRFK